MTTFSPRPYEIQIPQTSLNDRSHRLASAHWPAKDIIPYSDAEKRPGYSFGPTLEWMKDFAQGWREFDWRAKERNINTFKHFKADIEGLDIHFIHHRSEAPDAIPLILCHGWPGSFLEFLDVIPLLTTPSPGTQAFHVVVPSQPGFAFSTPPPNIDWKMDDTARVFDKLMIGLGYDRYAAQGGDWGSVTARMLGSTHADHCKAVHLNFCPVPPQGLLALIPPRTLLAILPNWLLSPLDRKRSEAALTYLERGSGYYTLQAFTPRTVAYGLNDSPIGLLAWIGEKMGFFLDQIEASGVPNPYYTRNTIFATLSLYWLTGTIGTSFSPYSHNIHFKDIIVKPEYYIPNLAVSNFINEIVIVQDRSIRLTGNLNWRKDSDRGGHFAATEEPVIFAQHVAEAIRAIWPLYGSEQMK